MDPTSSSWKASSSLDKYRIPSVTIAEGSHKYVLISAVLPSGYERQHFVVSRREAVYHRNVAEPMIKTLERSGYSRISVHGGGWMDLKKANKKIRIYGSSCSFGLVSICTMRRLLYPHAVRSVKKNDVVMSYFHSYLLSPK